MNAETLSRHEKQILQIIREWVGAGPRSTDIARGIATNIQQTREALQSLSTRGYTKRSKSGRYRLLDP